MQMSMRKVTFKLYPSTKQEALLLEHKRLHQQLYNAALEQKRDRWAHHRQSMSFSQQCKQLTLLRREVPEFKVLNAQSSQVTLKRLHLAFDGFFRRVKQGETPGYPRFKSLERFSGWGYKSHGDGFRVYSDGHHGTLYLSQIGKMKMRGKARQWGDVKTCEILHKQGQWYASVTVECEPERVCGQAALGLDWGVETFATLVNEQRDVTTVDNPRHLREALAELEREQRLLSRKQRGSNGWKKQKKRVAAIHGKVARQRLDFLHQTTASLVADCGLIATEELNVSSMTRKGSSKAKKSLNREILACAPARFLEMLRVKAEEAGLALHEVNTRQVKPSQTCPGCAVQRKKALSQRTHECKRCGCKMKRDAASALVMLHHALYGRATGREPAWSGAVQLSLF